MISPILQLDTDELLSAVDAIDPVDVLAAELVGKAGAGQGTGMAGTVGQPWQDSRLAPWHAGGRADEPGTELVLLEDRRTGSSCVLPAAALTGFRSAALAALAARTFVAPGVVTAAVLGSGVAAQLSLALIARYLPGLSHVAVWAPGDEPGGPLDPRMIDQLDLTGVGWSVAPSVAEAVFGATLVVATVAAAPWGEIGQLPKSAVLVNTTGVDLPDELVDAVDEIYVDDGDLVAGNAHRYFARAHLAQPGAGPAWPSRAQVRPHRRVEADLADVLTRAHAGRTHVDHVLLVELLSTTVLDARLASLLHRAALEHGLGMRLDE